MAAFSYSLDDFGDSGGEALGDGLDSSALDLSGSTSLDDFSQSTLQGSSLDLGGVGGLESTTFGAPSLEDQFALSGVSDPMASSLLDTLQGDSNGSGSAASTHPLQASISDAGNASLLFSGISKFGSSIGQLFAVGAAPTAATVNAGVANANPNRISAPGIGTSHALLVVGIVILVGAIIAGGKYGVR